VQQALPKLCDLGISHSENDNEELSDEELEMMLKS
jgi:hypothetical protein